MTARRAGVFLACALFRTSALAQQPPLTTHIAGVVVDAQTSTPIRRARVDAGVTSTTWAAVFTDERGVFAADIPHGAAVLTITKAGFVPETATLPAKSGDELPAVRVSMQRAASITGRLVDAAGTPLMNINVCLRDVPSGEQPAGGRRRCNASTDDLGEFRFGGLRSGEFAIDQPVASEPRRVGAGEAVDLGDVVYERSPGVTAVAARVQDPRRAPAITGTIWDEYGEPIQGAFVHVLQITRVQDRLAAMPPDGISFRASDDRGSYRVFGLRAGRYLVVASVQGYADTYYSGGTNVAFATPIVIGRADADGVDITFRREPTVTVSGTAMNSTGQPAVGAVVLSVSQRSGAIMTQPRAAMLAYDGTFAFDNIPPGEYVVQVNDTSGLAPKVVDGKLMVPRTEFAMQRLTIVDAPPPPLRLRTTRGATLWGKIVADGAASPPRGLVVFPSPTDVDQSFTLGSGGQGLTKNEDGSFVITGVTGPRRFRIIAPAGNWYIKEARVAGADALSSPFDFGLQAKDIDGIEIVVSPMGAAVAGTVTTAAGEPADGYSVVVFSTDSSSWYSFSQSVRIDRAPQSREFHIAALPPGPYYVVALDGGSDIISSGDWQDPATLEKLVARATRITLGEGEQRTLALRLQ